MAEDVGPPAGDGGRGARAARHAATAPRERVSGAARGRQGPRPLAAAAGRLLLAAARRLRRRGAQGRGHRHGRLRPLGAAVLRGRRGLGEVGAVPRAQPRQALDPDQPQGGARAARCCCGSCASTTCCSSRFRPGRARPARRRLRAPARGEPGLVYCAITGYGQDGPYRDRSGHDMNYLGLVGLLGLTGERGRAAGAVGRPDRRPRRRRADGGVRDPGRAARARPLRRGPARGRLDGRRRAVLARDGGGAATSPTARCPSAASSSWPGALVCYRPYACSDGWVTLGALEPKFWQAWCRGVGPRGPDREAVRAARAPRRTPRSSAIFLERTRDEWQRVRLAARLLPRAGARPRRGARLRARARARDGRRARPAGRRAAVRQLGVPVKLSRTPGAPAGPGPGARRAHATRCSPGSATPTRRSRRSRSRAPWRARSPGAQGASWRERSENGLLKMRELAEASGVSAGTIKHYLREGLLPEPVKTSRNMAYYPPEFVERIRLIKQLQEERFMPLKLIKAMLDEDPERARALVELEDRILERALAGEQERVSARRAARAATTSRRRCSTGSPSSRCSTPNTRGYGAARRADRRGDLPLPRRRLRRADRLHRLRHAALQARARGARQGGGRRCCWSAWRARWTPTGPSS